MKLRAVSMVLSSAAAVATLALCSTARAQAPETIVVVGGQPDVVYVDSAGNVIGASDVDSTNVSPNSATMGSLSPVTVQGVSGDWVPGIDVPVVPGVVIRNDIMTDRAIVKTRFGYVSVHTGAGARVLYKDQLANWLTVPPGQVVQLPLDEIISGPVPHKLRVHMPATTAVTGASMGMTPGMGTVGATVTTNGQTTTITGSTTTTTTMDNSTPRRRRGRRRGNGTGTGTP